MKKTLVTLLAASTLAVAVAPIASATIKTPDTKIDARVEHFGLKVATLKAKLDLAETAYNAASANATGREVTLNATKTDLTNAEKAVADLQKEQDDFLGAFAIGTKVEGFVNAQAVINHYKPLIDAAQKTVETRKTAVEVAQKDLDDRTAEKTAAGKALDEAKAALDAAINEAIAAGLTRAQVEGYVAGAAGAAGAANNSAKPAAANTPTGQKTLPKTSAAK